MIIEIFFIKNEIKSKLRLVLEFGVFLVFFESPWQVKFNNVHLTIWDLIIKRY